MRGDTDRLIEQLAAQARPVMRPLAPPLVRTLAWCGAVVAVALLVVVLMGWRRAARGFRASGRPLVVVAACSPACWPPRGVPGQRAGPRAGLGVAADAGGDRLVSPAWAGVPGAGACRRRRGGPRFGSWHCALAITLVSAPMLLVMLLLVRHAAWSGQCRPRCWRCSARRGPVVRRGQPGPRPRKRAAHPGLARRRGAAAVRGGVVSGRPLLGWIGYAPLTGTLLRAAVPIASLPAEQLVVRQRTVLPSRASTMPSPLRS